VVPALGGWAVRSLSSTALGDSLCATAATCTWCLGCLHQGHHCQQQHQPVVPPASQHLTAVLLCVVTWRCAEEMLRVAGAHSGLLGLPAGVLSVHAAVACCSCSVAACSIVSMCAGLLCGLCSELPQQHPALKPPAAPGVNKRVREHATCCMLVYRVLQLCLLPGTGVGVANAAYGSCRRQSVLVLSGEQRCLVPLVLCCIAAGAGAIHGGFVQEWQDTSVACCPVWLLSLTSGLTP